MLAISKKSGGSTLKNAYQSQQSQAINSGNTYADMEILPMDKINEVNRRNRPMSANPNLKPQD